ncbi:MAG TPA: outer membrane beta-barrel protein [Afifellaceae bacterium]|nr:outer membrane beta-barrel protein [Afifellaceae bacterium]
MRPRRLRAIAARLSAAGLLLCGCAAASAAAQGIDDPAAGLPVRERERQGYDPAGARLGSFLFYPSLLSAPFYDSNLFAAPANPVSDVGVLYSPRLLAESQFGRHGLRFEIGADHFRYRRQRSEDRTNLFARAEGRLDIQREMVALATLDAGLLHEDRGSPDSPALAAEPVAVRRLAGTATINRTFNRFGLSLGTAIVSADYEDVSRIGGGTLDQDFRDHIIYSLGGRASYAWSTGHRLFADLRANWRHYGNSGPIPLDSQGFVALTGLEFALTTLLHGEIGLGYLRQDYHSPDIAAVEGPTYLANLIWNATPLMTLSVKGARQVQDTTGAGAVARIESSFEAVLDYELLRNLIISPSLRFAHEDYAGISRSDTVLEPGLKLEYFVNRFLAVGGKYIYTTRDSKVTGNDYVRHQASIHAKAQF